jgi:sarcosine oxidase subunit alpha
MPRLQPPSDPVTLRFDGEEVAAQRGEPVAVALVAAGHLALARSPKFHRPRGPWCQRAACDGCLARVDDVPNVMTCRVPAADGMRIETQNVVGSREHDMLRMTDWFFAEGLNHHELFAGVPGLQQVMQALARRVAGLGKLPREVRPARDAARRQVDALVVGSGPSGMAAAVRLCERGRRVEVLDDDLTWGGCLGSLVGAAREPWAPLMAAFDRARAAGRLTLRLEVTAAAIYGDDVLVAGPDGMELIAARTLVLAPGAHDGVLAFEDNDAPAVMSARAVGRMLGLGVVPGERMVIAVAPGGGPFGAAIARAVPSATLVEGVPAGVRGGGRVREWLLSTGGSEARHHGDVLVVDAPRAPAYELCAQAGASLVHEDRGFVVRTDGGRIGGGGAASVFAVGEAVGTPLDPAAIDAEAARVAGMAGDA